MKLYITVIVCSIGAAVQGWDREFLDKFESDLP